MAIYRQWHPGRRRISSDRFGNLIEEPYVEPERFVPLWQRPGMTRPAGFVSGRGVLRRRKLSELVPAEQEEDLSGLTPQQRSQREIAEKRIELGRTREERLGRPRGKEAAPTEAESGEKQTARDLDQLQEIRKRLAELQEAETAGIDDSTRAAIWAEREALGRRRDAISERLKAPTEVAAPPGAVPSPREIAEGIQRRVPETRIGVGRGIRTAREKKKELTEVKPTRQVQLDLREKLGRIPTMVEIVDELDRRGLNTAGTRAKMAAIEQRQRSVAETSRREQTRRQAEFIAQPPASGGRIQPTVTTTPGFIGRTAQTEAPRTIQETNRRVEVAAIEKQLVAQAQAGSTTAQTYLTKYGIPWQNQPIAPVAQVQPQPQPVVQAQPQGVAVAQPQPAPAPQVQAQPVAPPTSAIDQLKLRARNGDTKAQQYLQRRGIAW